VGVLYRKTSGGVARPAAAELPHEDVAAMEADDALVRWLAAAGYPPGDAAGALAEASGDREAALLHLYSSWTGG